MGPRVGARGRGPLVQGGNPGPRLRRVAPVGAPLASIGIARVGRGPVPLALRSGPEGAGGLR